MKINLNKKRIVVTGIGVVSPIGIGRREFWNNLIEGKSGISQITDFDISQYDRHLGGEVKNFDPSKYVNKHRIPKIGRASQMVIAASRLALEDASFKISDLRTEKSAVCVGTTVGELRVLEKFHDADRDNKGAYYKYLIAKYPASSLSANIAIELKLKGINLVIATACAAGNYAIGNAYDLIRSGQVDYALAGGADSFSRVVYTGFSRLNSIAKDKCQPFDQDRQGMIPSEGAGILFLETLDSAKKRKAEIYAEILGYGLSCDGNHMTIPSVDGVQSSMEKSMKNSHVKAEEVDYICAHGTGTKENDKVECQAFSNIFHERLPNIPVSSIKSMIGHTMGAASAIEAAACCMGIKEGLIPPTMNLNKEDPDCSVDCVPGHARRRNLKIILNNSQAFGGNNSCLVLRKY